MALKITKKARKGEVRAIIDRRPFHAPFPQTDLARLNELRGCSHKAGRRLPNPISRNRDSAGTKCSALTSLSSDTSEMNP